MCSRRPFLLYLALIRLQVVPVVIVFTQYDRLVRTKKAKLKVEYGNLDATQLNDRSEEEAQKAFNICVQSLQRTVNRLRIPVPPHVKVSGIFVQFYLYDSIDYSLVRPGYQEGVSTLVENTRDIVKQRLKGDAWITWAIAQRPSLMMHRPRIPVFPYVKVSGIFVQFYLYDIDYSLVRPGYQENVSALVESPRDIVKQRLKCDARIMWAIAQRVKIEACITYVTCHLLKS